MALGKLTFLCLNAICIGALALLVLGALIRMYGQPPPHVRSRREPRPAALEPRRQASRLRTVEPDVFYLDDEPGGRRFRKEPKREVSYEYEYRR